MIIAIDGTSGSGKSSAAELFSERQSLTLLNTGSHYRVITQECLKKEIEIEQTRLEEEYKKKKVGRNND